MGDDDRRHLDELRRRAYGPGEGLTDAADIARLEELEAAARAGRPTPAEPDPDPVDGGVSVDEPHPVAGPVDPPAATDGPSAGAGTGSSPDAGARTGGIRRGLLVLGAAVAAVAVVVAVVLPRLTDAPEPGAGAPSASPTETVAPDDLPVIRRSIDDAATETIMTIELNGYFSQPAPSPEPVLPVNGAETWIETVGEYFGQRVWLGGTDEGDVCLVLEAESTTRTSCLPFDMFEDDLMLLTVPFSDLPAQERPPGMTEDQLLGFWWRSTDRVEIVMIPSQPGSAEY